MDKASDITSRGAARRWELKLIKLSSLMLSQLYFPFEEKTA